MAFDRNKGYYLSASLLRKLPYDYIGIRRFVELVQPLAASMRADLMGMRDTTMTEYAAVISNELNLRGDVLLDIDDLDYEMVSSLRIKMRNGMKLLLNVCFLDDHSYEVCLSLPGWKSPGPDAWAFKHMEKLACSLADCVQPIYGCLGIESNTCSLSEIQTGEFFSVTDQIYFCSSFIDMHREALGIAMQGYTFHALEHGSYSCRGSIGAGNMLPRHTQQQIGGLLSDYITA